MTNFIPEYVEHPGSIIKEELEERGWTQRDLAYILGRTEQTVNAIIAGRRGISADMAKDLGEAFDVPAEFFVNLQKMYDLAKAKEPSPGIARRARFFQSSYPVREMIKRGWIEDAELDLLEVQMSRFFDVSSVDEIPHLAHAARKTNYDEIPTNQLAWLFRAKHIAKSIEVPRYSAKKMEKALEELSNLRSAPEEVRHVPRILMNCGVRYIIIETLPKANIDGVCFWLNKYCPVIGMSLRFDRIDNFWFVLRHEIEHVLQKHGQDAEIIDTDMLSEQSETIDNISEEEQVANDAAAAFCVPQDKIVSFYIRKNPYISNEDILGFARTLNIHPGLVVGQLHNITKEYRYFRKYLAKVRHLIIPSALVDGWGNVAPVSL